MNFIDTHKTDFSILGRLHKADQLRHRSIQHTYNKLCWNHDPESYISIDYSNGTVECNGNIHHTINELRTEWLCIIDFQHFQIQPVYPCLNSFPFPAFKVFVIVYFNFLNIFNGLHPIALVLGIQFKIFPVELFTYTQKSENPRHIDSAARYEYKKDHRIINQQYNAEYNECNDGEEHPQRIIHHKTAYSFMIACSLKDITDQLIFEESHR